MPSQPEMHLYEYAVVRFVPSIEREEFVNIGLLMMCKRRRWVRFASHLSDARLDAFVTEADPIVLRQQLHAFSLIAEGSRRGGPIAELPAEERFRWLTAVRSASLQTSRPHPGHTADLDAEFDRLFARLVL